MNSNEFEKLVMENSDLSRQLIFAGKVVEENAEKKDEAVEYNYSNLFLGKKFDTCKRACQAFFDRRRSQKEKRY